MYSLSFLIIELETARTTLLDVFEVSNGTPNRTWQAGISGWAVRQNLPLNDVFSQIDEYEKESAH
jgi:hypothetical protein